MRPSDLKSEKVLKTPPSAVDPLMSISIALAMHRGRYPPKADPYTNEMNKVPARREFANFPFPPS